MRAIAGMIFIASIIAGVAVFVSTSAFAQQGPEYVNHEYRFMLNFPVALMEEDAVYVSSDGETHAAKVFSAEEGTSRYRMSVVRFQAEIADVQAEVHHAAELVRPRGQILHDQPSNYDGIRGLELILTSPQGRQIYANVLYHFISSYADGGDAPDKPLELVPGAIEDADTLLEHHGDTQERFQRVTELVEGFESAFGLELLATVHWVLEHEAVGSTDDVIARTHAWNEQKKRFSPRQIRLAEDALIEKGWIGNTASQGP